MAIGSCFQPDLQQETVVNSRAEGSKSHITRKGTWKVVDREGVVAKEISIIRKKLSFLQLDNRKIP